MSKDSIFEISLEAVKCRKEKNRIFNEIQKLRNDVYILNQKADCPGPDAELVKAAKALNTEIQRYFG